MKHTPKSAIYIEAPDALPEDTFSDLFASLGEHGVPRHLVQYAPKTYGFLEWLIPTSVVLVVTHSYVDGILKEIGKEHYLSFKKAVSSLYKKCLGRKPEIRTVIMRGDGKTTKPSHFSGTLSFSYLSPRGYTIKLLFPLDVSADDYARSCQEFITLLASHSDAVAAEDPISREVGRAMQSETAKYGKKHSLASIHSSLTFLVFWDRHSQSFHVVDQSHPEAKSLVSRPLGNT